MDNHRGLDWRSWLLVLAGVAFAAFGAANAGPMCPTLAVTVTGPLLLGGCLICFGVLDRVRDEVRGDG